MGSCNKERMVDIRQPADQIIQRPQGRVIRRRWFQSGRSSRRENTDRNPVPARGNVTARLSTVRISTCCKRSMWTSTRARHWRWSGNPARVSRLLARVQLRPAAAKATGTITFDGRELAPAFGPKRPSKTARDADDITRMVRHAMNRASDRGTIIGRPLKFYFGLKGKAKTEAYFRNCWTRSETRRRVSGPLSAELSGGPKQVSASPVRWPPSQADHLRRGSQAR